MIPEATFFQNDGILIVSRQFTRGIPLKSFNLLIILFYLTSLLTACSIVSGDARGRDAAQIQALITTGANIDEVHSKTGRTPLHDAVCCGRKDLVNQLIEKGADIDAKDKDGATPLILAVTSNNGEISNYLIERGANINAFDGAGYTPLLWAIYSGYIDLAVLLMDKGADINLGENSGMTPLITACSYGQVEIAMKLVERNANVLAIDSSGYKASDYVRYSSFSKIINPSKHERSVELAKQLKNKEESLILQDRGSSMAKLTLVIKKVRDCINPHTDYEIFISQQGGANAWVNMSGKITVTKLAVETWDEDTLTFVVAHEVAHDKLGHVTKRMGVSYTTTGVMVVVGSIIPGAGLLNHLINPAITNNYSKMQEYEADSLASEYCDKCFGMTNEKQLAVMHSLKEKSKTHGGGFFATHPAWNDRIENIKK